MLTKKTLTAVEVQNIKCHFSPYIRVQTASLRNIEILYMYSLNSVRRTRNNVNCFSEGSPQADVTVYASEGLKTLEATKKPDNAKQSKIYYRCTYTL